MMELFYLKIKIQNGVLDKVVARTNNQMLTFSVER